MHPLPPQPGIGIRPQWAQRMFLLHRAAIANQFVIHFNINDYVVDLNTEREDSEFEKDKIPTGNVVGRPRLFREYLHDLLYAPINRKGFGSTFIYTYSLAGGLLAESSPGLNDPAHALAWERAYQANDAVMQQMFQRRRPQEGQPQEGREVNISEKMIDNLRLLGHMLRTRQEYQGHEAPIGVILDFTEKMIPYHVGEGHGDREQLQALETIQSWGMDSKIRNTLNVIILLTTNIGQIPNHIYSGGSGCQEIRVYLPNQDERRAYINYQIQAERFAIRDFDPHDFPPDEGQEGQIRQLANMTQGLRLRNMEDMSHFIMMQSQIRNETPVMKTKFVQEAKEEAITSQSESLLEIIRSPRGFEEIGGLEKLKKYLKERTTLMKLGQRNPIIPSGLLLAGPPGTGKTIIAEALAKESGFNIVKMRNIRDKWVGSSERNLDMVLKLLDDLQPVVVFVDEVDQAMGQRDTGQSGDSGVGARMFGRILEVMSDQSHRGRILWVAATNRADLLDDALLRRFDRVIPLLPPDEIETENIFRTMSKTIRKHSGNQMEVQYDPVLLTDGGFRDVAKRSMAMGLTGAGIEIVVRRAIEITCEDEVKAGRKIDEQRLPLVSKKHIDESIRDFKPNQNTLMYDFQSLIAIRACNFYSVLPEELPHRSPFTDINGSDGKIDPQKLDRIIRKLARQLAGSEDG